MFAAGLALQRIKGRAKPGDPSSTAKVKLVLDAESERKLATHAELAGAYMMEAVQGFNGQLERLAELVVVMVVGAMLSYTYVPSGVGSGSCSSSSWWRVPHRYGSACGGRTPYRATSAC